MLPLGLVLGVGACGLGWAILRTSPAPPPHGPSPAPAARPAAPEAVGGVHAALASARGPGPFAAHQGTVTWAGFSPSGRRVFTGSRGGDGVLWDHDGRALAHMEGHRAAVGAAAFSAKGPLLATGSADGTARIWHLDGRLVAALEGHDDEVVAVAFAPGGAHVLTRSLDGTARVWNTEGRVLAVLAPAGGVEAAAFSPDGRRVLTAAAGRPAVLWDLEGREIARIAPEGGVAQALFTPGGGRLLVRTPGASAHLFDLEGRHVATLEGHRAPVLAMATAEVGEPIATASLDGTARLWSARGEPLAVLSGHAGPVHDLFFAGSRIVTVSSDRTARLWEPDGRPVAVLGSRERPVRMACASPDAAWLFTGAMGAPDPCLWDGEGRLHALLPAPGGRTLQASFSPAGDRLLLRSRDLTVRVVPVGEEALRAEAARWAAEDSSSATSEARALLAAWAARDPAAAGGEVREPVRERLGPDGTARGDYVGAAACAGCHREAYDAWRASAHATTLAPAVPANVPPAALGGEHVAHPPGWTRFLREGDRFLAQTLAEDGRTRAFPLTHVVGARRIQMLLTTLEDGRRQVLPAMRELPAGPWFDYTHLLFGAPGLDPALPPIVGPGDPSFWTGPVRSFDARCASCHASGREPRAPGPDGTGPRSTWRATGVDCEACHGAGRAHAEAWERMETDAPLPRLETLDRTGAVQACTQCHMEGERLTPRFVVGEDLYEHLDPTLLLDPERADAYGRPLELIYGGLPFGTSRCAEEGGLTCAHCHASHGSANRSSVRERLADGRLCGTCHEEIARDPATHAHHDPRGAGGRCIACHMPFLEIERGHGAVADHTIGIPLPGLPGDRVARDACTWCHQQGREAPPGAPALGADALRAAHAAWWPRAAPHPWMAALAAARLDEEGAEHLLAAVLADRTAPRLVRASAARLLERTAPGSEPLVLAASRDPDALVRRSAVAALAALPGPEANARLRQALADRSAAVRRSAAHAVLAGWTRAQESPDLLRAALPVLEADALAVLDDDLRWFRLGAARELAGDLAGAIEAYERQLALDPFAHAVRRHLPTLRARLASEAGR